MGTSDKYAEELLDLALRRVVRRIKARFKSVVDTVQPGDNVKIEGTFGINMMLHSDGEWKEGTCRFDLNFNSKGEINDTRKP